jgi:hypothetical protein
VNVSDKPCEGAPFSFSPNVLYPAKPDATLERNREY